jgi:hypothetical protein
VCAMEMADGMIVGLRTGQNPDKLSPFLRRADV